MIPQMPTAIETPLGHACPPAPNHSAEHSITSHLPSWQTLLDFSDGKPELLAAIRNMYPRLAPISHVKKLNETIIALDGQHDSACFLFPTRFAAEACQQFVLSAARAEVRLSEGQVSISCFSCDGRLLYAVFVPADKKLTVVPFWKNTGLGVSTRFAEYFEKRSDEIQRCDAHTSVSFEESPSHAKVKERIISLMERAPRHVMKKRLNESDVFLFTTGQAAVYQVQRYLGTWRKGTTILFGFSFTSTEHSLADFETTTTFKFFGRGSDYAAVEEFLAEEEREGRRIQNLFVEFPSNPLLHTPDLARLRRLADRYDFPIVVDETIASFCNVDLLSAGEEGPDVLVTSLTKSFSGYSDVMGGSAVLNTCSKYYHQLQSTFHELHTNDLFEGDAEILGQNSEDYLERSSILNSNAQTLAKFLEQHSKTDNGPILRVYYPCISGSRPAYEDQMRPATTDFHPGYGCLFNVELKTTPATIAFYDTLGRYLHTGPHLGAHLTLVFAYNQALYAKELDKIGHWGLNRRQIRVSAGLEDVDLLKRIFEVAVGAARDTLVKQRSVDTVGSIS